MTSHHVRATAEPAILVPLVISTVPAAHEPGISMTIAGGALWLRYLKRRTKMNARLRCA